MEVADVVVEVEGGGNREVGLTEEENHTRSMEERIEQVGGIHSVEGFDFHQAVERWKTRLCFLGFVRRCNRLLSGDRVKGINL